MPKFTQVNIRRGTVGLSHSKGFWSGKEVLFNNDESTIYVLDEKTTTQDLIDTILGVIDAGIRDWVLWDMRRNIEILSHGKYVRHFFTPQIDPALQRREWMTSKGPSMKLMLECWQQEGKTSEQLCEFLTDQWISAYRRNTNLCPNMKHGVPPEISLARLLFIRWENFSGSMPLNVFLQGLWDLAEMDMSGGRFLGSGQWGQNLYNYKKNHQIIRDSLIGEERELLAKHNLSFHLEGKMSNAKVRTVLTSPTFASLAILVLAEKGLILPPKNISGDPVSRIRELGWMKPFDKWFSRNDEQYKMGFMLICSTIRDPRDIPADLRIHWKQDSTNLNLKCLRRLLIGYGEENALSPFDTRPLERGMATRINLEKKKWRAQWFRDQNHSEEWCSFADVAYASNNAGVKVVADRLKSFCSWALSRFKSPWDISPADLLNPHNPKGSNTFAACCKKEASSGGKDPQIRWSNASSVFKSVVNAVSIPGYPWSREDVVNPFEKIGSPFKGNRNRNQKTHRSRIATLIHDKMVEVLLDLDEQGRPTFAWAKTQFIAEDMNDEGTWCPSRWTLLGSILLLPLRKSQGRWLDQGLMDQMVFDPETFQMVENTHPLRDYTYEDGQSHLQRYGRPSGAIQQMTDSFMGVADHVGLFVNTNKTQLWNSAKRNGYELPWPDGSELLAKDDAELRQHGYWLRRVYEVLAYQYRHVMEHDPNPEPISFTDIRGDTDKVSVDEECVNRMPRFVPLFRETLNKKQVERDGKRCLAAMPVTEAKLESAYIVLCMEVEKRLKAEGYDSVSLTMPSTKKTASKSGINSRKAKFDIHCLRVAGISRLIELGIDPVIVQEFVAGHLTPAMTHRYLKMQPWHVREKIIEAIVNGDFKSAMETFAEKVAKGDWNQENTFVGLPRFRDHVANLPEDFACFSVVKGGVCVMGGKGDACNEGGVYEREGGEVDFGSVQGGCGNCIYFRTAAFLIQEQALVLNILLAELRAQAKERKELRVKIVELECQIDEATGPARNNFIDKKFFTKLVSRKSTTTWFRG